MNTRSLLTATAAAAATLLALVACSSTPEPTTPAPTTETTSAGSADLEALRSSYEAVDRDWTDECGDVERHASPECAAQLATLVEVATGAGEAIALAPAGEQSADVVELAKRAQDVTDAAEDLGAALPFPDEDMPDAIAKFLPIWHELGAVLEEWRAVADG